MEPKGQPPARAASASAPKSAPARGELVFQTGRQSGTRRPLQPLLTFIGRNASCDIRLNVEGVDPQHCLVAHGPDGTIARDLDSAGGTLLNGERIKSAPLHDGDVLTVGPVQFRVHLPKPAAAPPPPPSIDGKDGWRVQVAAVVAQQIAMTEEESRLQQRRKAFEKQEEQSAAHLEDKRRKLVQLSERTQAERNTFDQERTAFEERIERVTGNLTPVQREILDSQNKIQAEKKRLVELNKRMRKHFRKKWAAEKESVAERERAVAEEIKSLDSTIRNLEKREGDLAARRLRFNSLYELGRRHIKDAWDRLRLEQHRWKHRRGKERAALKVRLRDVENGERKLIEVQKRFLHEQKSWEARRNQLDQEVDTLETRVRNHRLKISEHQDLIQRLEAELRERQEQLALPPTDGAAIARSETSNEANPAAHVRIVGENGAAESHASAASAADAAHRAAAPMGPAPALTPRMLALHARQAKQLKQHSKKQPGKPEGDPKANPLPQERALLQRLRDIETCAGQLADQRTQLIEQWQRVVLLQDRWEHDRRQAGQELEELAGKLMEKGELLVEREQSNQQAEQTIRQRHEELVQVRQHLIAWRSRLRVREKSWDGEREQLFLEIRKREELANRQLNALLELRQRWNKRRRQEIASLKEERQSIQALRQEFTQQKMALSERTAALEEEKRILSEKALAFEQYKQELMSKVETPLAERRIERLRRRWLTQNANIIRATLRDREIFKEEMAALEARYAELQKRSEEVVHAEADLAEKLAAFEHKQTLATARQTRLQDELKNVEAMRSLSMQQVTRMKEEVERIARSLIDEPDPPHAQAQVAASKAA